MNTADDWFMVTDCRKLDPSELEVQVDVAEDHHLVAWSANINPFKRNGEMDEGRY
jgi:hypothetical protein